MEFLHSFHETSKIGKMIFSEVTDIDKQNNGTIFLGRTTFPMLFKVDFGKVCLDFACN